jgi:hypothetical protein
MRGIKKLWRRKRVCFPFPHSQLFTHLNLNLALEALISSLRSHLTRLTSELASHQALLSELRRLRDSDAQALREKGAEILQLKEEVQRLAGEVEVLRGVVEEGLKERRSAREIHIEGSAADLGMSQDLEEEDNDNEDELELEEEEPDNNEHERDQDKGVDEREFDDDDEDEEDEPVPFDPNPAPLRAADRTMRTDFATLGSSTNSAPLRFVNDDELDLIAAEVEERRSNRSNASSVGSGSGTQRARPRSRSPPVRRSKRATVEDEHEEEQETSRRHQLPYPALPASSQHYTTQPQLNVQHAPSRFASSHPEPSTSRPTAPTPGSTSKTHERRRTGRTSDPVAPEPETETPFPQIRGEHLERLFFSAPEHNAKTCTVCYRRRNRPSGASPSWSHVRGKGTKYASTSHDAVQDEKEDGQEEEDEGYEGSEDADVDHRATNGKGKERERERERERESERERERQFVVSFSQDPSHWRQAGRKHGLPPQTVVARVIRELEDDFTHYKRYVSSVLFVRPVVV